MKHVSDDLTFDFVNVKICECDKPIDFLPLALGRLVFPFDLGECQFSRKHYGVICNNEKDLGLNQKRLALKRANVPIVNGRKRVASLNDM